jgi:hypothetical protein
VAAKKTAETKRVGIGIALTEEQAKRIDTIMKRGTATLGLSLNKGTVIRACIDAGLPTLEKKFGVS